MLHRIALVIGSLTAAAVLAVGLAAVGLGPGDPAANALNGAGAAAAGTPDVGAATAGPKTVVDTIYVRPAAKAKVIHVTRTDRPSPTATPRHKTTSTKRNGGGEGDDNGGERDGGGEGGEGGDD